MSMKTHDILKALGNTDNPLWMTAAEIHSCTYGPGPMIDSTISIKLSALYAAGTRVTRRQSNRKRFEYALISRVNASDKAIAPTEATTNQSPQIAEQSILTQEAVTLQPLNLDPQLMVKLEGHAYQMFLSILRSALQRATSDLLSEINTSTLLNVQTPLQPQVSPKPEVIELPKPSTERLSIIIAGLINPQITKIEKDFGTSFNLRYWRTEHSIKQLGRSIKHADVVIGFVDKMNHAADEVCSKHRSYIRVSGGMSSLDDLLTAIYTKHLDDPKFVFKQSLIKSTTGD